jgi:thiol-disulfide isomerase/thioredoxin
MNRINTLYIILILVTSNFFTLTIEAQTIKVVNYNNLKPAYTNNSDTLYVVNFWATWCRPCVEELPHFMEVNEKFTNSARYKMILVSLDDSEKAGTTVTSFAKRLKLNTDLYLLDDIKRMNEWIRDTDSSWSGSIPATLFIKKGKSLHFTEGVLSKEELESLIKKNL